MTDMTTMTDAAIAVDAGATMGEAATADAAAVTGAVAVTGAAAVTGTAAVTGASAVPGETAVPGEVATAGVVIRNDAACGGEDRGARLERLAVAYRADRRERGPRTADGEWAGGAIDDWVDNLTGARRRLRPVSVDALTVGMAETLAVRDALIVSLVTGGDGLDKAVLMDFVRRPHTPRACGRMGGMLSRAFRDPAGRPDRSRCLKGVAMLEHMAAGAPDRFRVQPLAAIAYVRWWNGDASAMGHALQALALDGRCSLASIVLGALRRGMYPAWHGEPTARPAPRARAGA